MANISSTLVKMTDVEIASDAPITEALFTKVGANINGLIDAGASADALISSLTSTRNVAIYSGVINSGGSGTATYTTGNNKQIYFAVAFPVSSGGIAFVKPGYSYVHGTSTVSIGGTNNRTLSIGDGGGYHNFSIIAFYEP